MIQMYALQMPFVSQLHRTQLPSARTCLQVQIGAELVLIMQSSEKLKVGIVAASTAMWTAEESGLQLVMAANLTYSSSSGSRWQMYVSSSMSISRLTVFNSSIPIR